MSGNTFGHVFRVTTFGESHGGGLVGVDGCPAGHPFPARADRRADGAPAPGPGQADVARQEADAVQVYSGLDPETGRTLGTPIMMMVGNSDARSHHYDDLAALYRPSHADYTYDARYGLRAVAGGGRASGARDGRPRRGRDAGGGPAAGAARGRDRGVGGGRRRRRAAGDR